MENIPPTLLQQNTAFGKAFGQPFFPKTLKDWNKLNNGTKESSTTVQFKNSLWASHR